MKGRPHPKPGSRYRILAAADQEYQWLVGRILIVDVYAGYDGLKDPYIRCTGRVVGSPQIGSIEFGQGVALLREEPPLCHCIAFPHPHRRNQNCLDLN